jgi:hypothetical protein
MKTLVIQHADDPENPLEYNGWKLYSFNHRHRSYKHPNEFFPDGKTPIGLRRKLACGTAFTLSYSEHGQCEWGVAGTISMPDFDSASFAGLLVWEQHPKDLGPKTYEDREKEAIATCAVYTAWCNGAIYEWRIEDENGNDLVPSERHYYDAGDELKVMASEAKKALAGETDVKIEGAGAWLAKYYDFVPKAA